MDETALPLTAPGGRILTAGAFGPHDGSVVIWLHGTPGSRLFQPCSDHLMNELGMRIITFDRPGYGRSTRLAGRRVADVAGDLETVAEAFNLQRFAVVGYSGGGPHALAAAALMPDRVIRCAAVASAAPFDAPDLDFLSGMSEGNVEEFTAASSGAEALAASLDPIAGTLEDDPYAFMAAFRADLPAVDQHALDRPDVEQLLVDSMSEGLRPGAGGWVDDDLAFVQPWGCDPARIRVPVGIWQGSEDALVPASHGEWLIDTIPGASGHMVSGVGHLGMLDYLEQIHRWLLG
jgi:pimeloyl-ACP methyl ester carboxylesterase